MTRVAGRLAASALLALTIASASMAQTVGDSSAAIVGTIADQTGAVVPGVKVCVSGPAVMSARCVGADADGAFRFAALPPGEYIVTLTAGGFEPLEREGVHVGPGETASLPVTIIVATERADLTVEGRADPIDRFTTSRAESFTAEQLAWLPGPRSMGGIVAVAPAVLMARHDVGGNTALTPGPWSAHGVAGQSRPTVDGISVANFNPFGLTLDYGSFEHVWLGLGAYSPNQPGPGIHVQVLTKSGGNAYRGSVYAAMEHERWQALNVDGEQINRGAAGSADVPATRANRLAGYHDVNADIGGFIRRNRMWWYSSVREQDAAQLRVNFPIQPVETRAWNATGKFTARTRGTDRVVVMAHRNVVRQPTRLDGFLLSAERAINESHASTSEQVSQGSLWKSEWSGTIRERWFVEARIGQFLASRDERPNGTDLDSPRSEDSASGAVTGVNREWTAELRRSQLTASVSRFARGRGTHLLQAGGELVRDVAGEEWIRGYAGDLLHVRQNGTPREVYLFETPSRSESGQWWYAAYGSDAWQATSRLSINAGLRFDRFRIFLPDQAHAGGAFGGPPVSFPAVGHLIAWNVLAPRLGASYALDASGSTIVKSTYGLYWLVPATGLGFDANPNARTWYARYAWSDRDASGRWEAGEEGTLLERRGGTPPDVVDPALRLPYMHEATLHVQRAAGARFVLSTGVVWRGERRQSMRQPAAPFEAFTVPTPRLDPGPDGRDGTADDGPTVVLYDLVADVDLGAGTVIRNVDRSDSDFITWEAAAQRPLSGRWALSASFAYTWSRDQANRYLNQPVRENTYPLSPNDLIHTDSGGRHVFGVWSAKAIATFRAPWQVHVASLIRHQSGQPFGRTFQTQLPNYGTVRVLAEPIGVRRQDHVTVVDVRFERPLRIQSARASAFVEVSNLLNANPEQNINWSSGNSYLRPLSILSPRIARIGVRLDW